MKPETAAALWAALPILVGYVALFALIIWTLARRIRKG